MNIVTDKTPPSLSTRKIKASATKPRIITTLFTKIVAHFSLGFNLKHPLTKSSRSTTEVELSPTDKELEKKIEIIYSA